MSQAISKKRSLTIDFLKLFAIFLVIWGHSLADLRDNLRHLDISGKSRLLCHHSLVS